MIKICHRPWGGAWIAWIARNFRLQMMSQQAAALYTQRIRLLFFPVVQHHMIFSLLGTEDSGQFRMPALSLFSNDPQQVPPRAGIEDFMILKRLMQYNK